LDFSIFVPRIILQWVIYHPSGKLHGSRDRYRQAHDARDVALSSMQG